MGSSIVADRVVMVAQAAAAGPSRTFAGRPGRRAQSSTTPSGSCGTVVTPRPRKPWRRLKPDAKKEPAGLNSALKVTLALEQGRVSGQPG